MRSPCRPKGYAALAPTLLRSMSTRSFISLILTSIIGSGVTALLWYHGVEERRRRAGVPESDRITHATLGMSGEHS